MLFNCLNDADALTQLVLVQRKIAQNTLSVCFLLDNSLWH